MGAGSISGFHQWQSLQVVEVETKGDKDKFGVVFVVQCSDVGTGGASMRITCGDATLTGCCSIGRGRLVLEDCRVQALRR